MSNSSSPQAYPFDYSIFSPLTYLWIHPRAIACLCVGGVAQWLERWFLIGELPRPVAYHDVHLMGDFLGVNHLLYVSLHGQLSHSSSRGR